LSVSPAFTTELILKLLVLPAGDKCERIMAEKIRNA